MKGMAGMKRMVSAISLRSDAADFQGERAVVDQQAQGLTCRPSNIAGDARRSVRRTPWVSAGSFFHSGLSVRWATAFLGLGNPESISGDPLGRRLQQPRIPFIHLHPP
jgi:hypothetical protein